MAIKVGYSVGLSGFDLKTGSPTMTIAGSPKIMTYSIAQTGDIGIGDIVLANAISYMTVSKTSTTQWGVRNINGTAASDVGSATTVTSIKRAFNSHEDAIHGATPMAADASHLNTLDLVAADFDLFIACYADDSDDSLTTIDAAWTTDATNRIKIFVPIDTVNEVNNSQRTDYIQNGGGYEVKSTAATGRSNFEFNASFVTIEGIKIVRTSANDSFRRAFDFQAGGNDGNDNTLEKCFIICESGNGDSVLVNHVQSNTSCLRTAIKDNIIISESSVCEKGLFSQASFADLASEQSHIYNNVIYGSFTDEAVRLKSLDGTTDAGKQDFKNNYMFNDTANPDITFSDSYTNAVVNFTNNASDDTTAGTSNNNKRILVTDADFVDETDGSLNLHIQSTSDLINNGVGPATDAETNTKDIDGDTRSGTTCDIGADEVVAVAVADIGLARLIFLTGDE